MRSMAQKQLASTCSAAAALAHPYAHLAFIIVPALYVLLLQSVPALARPLEKEADRLSASPSSFKLALTSVDFGLPINVTLYQGLERGLHRSNLRLKHFQRITSTAVHMNGGDVSFKTPVLTAAGGFLTTVSVGTPPASFTAIIDTGSDLVWRQCLPCEHCYEQASGIIFDPSKSSTYEHVPCNDTLCSALPSSICAPAGDSSSSSSRRDAPLVCFYDYHYGDQSFTIGDFSYDTLTLPDLVGQPRPLHRFAFGCGHNNSFEDGKGSFAGAAGLIGFGQGPLSLPSQLHVPKFSYCLQSISDSTSLTSPLFIGAAAAAAIQSTSHDSVLSTPLISNPILPNFYYVNLRGISVGGKAIHIPLGLFDIQEDGTGGVIFDSGTTVTFLAADAYDAMLAAFRTHIPLLPLADVSMLGFDLCYTTSSLRKLRKKRPSLTFHFAGADMELPWRNYFTPVYEDLQCLTLARSTDAFSIFGNIQQQNFHILYDLEARRISFAPATCDKL